jgi:hypothetical protein
MEVMMQAFDSRQNPAIRLNHLYQFSAGVPFWHILIIYPYRYTIKWFWRIANHLSYI